MPIRRTSLLFSVHRTLWRSLDKTPPGALFRYKWKMPDRSRAFTHVYGLLILPHGARNLHLFSRLLKGMALVGSSGCLLHGWRRSRERSRERFGNSLLGATISKMAKTPEPKSRRRSKSPLSRKIFVYFTAAERKLVDSAAEAERRSISSFVANAAIVAAQNVHSRQSKEK
jgi:hypothetical protein